MTNREKLKEILTEAEVKDCTKCIQKLNCDYIRSEIRTVFVLCPAEVEALQKAIEPLLKSEYQRGYVAGKDS
jgi:hypothetical protein